ncbi:pantoate--beta-alanine ligase [Vigna unguiculata]|uniref:Pantoate--beta-alanine ligase n=1 Tax=Vigna unguiculata TaxID=3917 RepID=A0A4D6NGZ9_VIGUN|nr:pantoate--beta-alanine ligase [Vigna unguiculata]
MATTAPKLISDKNEMRNWSRSMRAQGKLIGFVPTMGFLHAGHLSLVSQARSLCDVVAVSIYVNPGQFAPSEDLSTYPSDFQGDLRKLAALPGGVDVVFHPRNLYDYVNNSGDVAGKGGGAAASCVDGDGSGHETWVRAEKLESRMWLCSGKRIITVSYTHLQFAPSEDLSTYPADFQGDLRKLAALPGGVDVVFHPRNLYDYGNNSGDVAGKGGGAAASCVDGDGSGHETWVRAEKLESRMWLCSGKRIITVSYTHLQFAPSEDLSTYPADFQGDLRKLAAPVSYTQLDVYKRQARKPDVAVFGKKDYQQLRVIQRMVRDLDFSIKVIGAEITRESDGLAMSSRNVHLSPGEGKEIYFNPFQALSINKSLLKAKSAAEDGEVHCEKLRNLVIQCISEAGGRVDYAEIVDQNNLEKVEKIKGPVVFCVAAWFGKVRLIDNMEINLSIDLFYRYGFVLAKLCQGQRLPQVEGERLTNLPQSMRREIRFARDSDGTSLPEKIWLKQQFSIGVNDVTRVLKRMKPCTELESSAQLVPLRSNNNKTPSVKLQVDFLCRICRP